jgi:hypothetical protein
MNRGRVGEERGGKEMDICPLTVGWYSWGIGGCKVIMVKSWWW